MRSPLAGGGRAVGLSAPDLCVFSTCHGVNTPITATFKPAMCSVTECWLRRDAGGLHELVGGGPALPGQRPLLCCVARGGTCRLRFCSAPGTFSVLGCACPGWGSVGETPRGPEAAGHAQLGLRLRVPRDVACVCARRPGWWRSAFSVPSAGRGLPPQLAHRWAVEGWPQTMPPLRPPAGGPGPAPGHLASLFSPPGPWQAGGCGGRKKVQRVGLGT